MSYPQTNDTGSGNLGYDSLALRGDVTGGPSGGSVGANKLWLPLWSGEVINAYDQFNIFENLISSKSLSGGFSYEFPVTGLVSLNASWDAGEELVGGDSSSTTFKINLDKRPMAAHFETDNVDLLITQWDYRSELARQAGLTLASTRDKQIVSALIAASVAAPLASDPRGLGVSNFPAPAIVNTTAAAIGVSVSSCSEPVALSILQKIENYLVFMQENDYPVQNVMCAVPPKVFQVIRALGIPRGMTNNVNLSQGALVGPDMTSGMNMLTDSLDYMGVKIVKTNHIPRNTITVGQAKYNLTCGTVDIFGIIFQKEAVAGLSLMGMKVDSIQDIRRNTQFTVASMLKGTGILRPELCQILIGLTTETVSSVAVADTEGEVNTRVLLAALLGAGTFIGEYAVTAA